jgi:hypothetical protein
MAALAPSVRRQEPDLAGSGPEEGQAQQSPGPRTSRMDRAGDPLDVPNIRETRPRFDQRPGRDGIIGGLRKDGVVSGS